MNTSETLASIRQEANKRIIHFINLLGWDGESYISCHAKTPMTFNKMSQAGMYYLPKDRGLKYYLSKRKNITEKMYQQILNSGLILINYNYYNDPLSEDSITTAIHEIFHSNRTILTNAQSREDEEIEPIFMDGHFTKSNNINKGHYADPAQDIFLGSIDDSQIAIEQYDDLTYDQKDDFSQDSTEFNEKLEMQNSIDEALIETMSSIAYNAYNFPQLGIMEILEKLNQKAKEVGESDIEAITNIILRHNDLALFEWMIEPLYNQLDYTAYDFFSRYLKKEDLKDLSNIISFSTDNHRVNDNEIDELSQEKKSLI